MMPATNDPRLTWIAKEIKLTDHVLDLGCAHHDVGRAIERGVWLHAHLAELTDSLLGVDMLESDVDRMRGMGYRAVCADVETMDLGQTFNVIVAGELIEHLSNPGLFLDRAREHLVGGGKLILSTPYPWSFVCFVGTLIRHLPINEQHTAWFDPVTLKQLLNRHGFRVDKLELVPLPVGVRGWHISRLLCNLGLKRIGACGILMICSKREQ